MKKFLFIFVCLVVVGVGAIGLLQLTGANTNVNSTPQVNTTTMIVVHEEYSSIDQMNAAFETDEVPQGGYVLINTGNVEDPDNASVYMKGAEGYEFVCDLSGAKGADGANGVDGVTPLLRISSDTGMWEVSYTAGTSWTSTGVTAQGPQGEQGEKGDTGATGATGAQGPRGEKGDTGARGPQGATGATGPAYVLTEADKQAIINAVLAQIGSGSGGSSGGSETYEVMFTWDGSEDGFISTASPSTEWPYQHVCDQCGAVLYSPNSSECYCPNKGYCSNIDGYFTTVRNPHYEGSGSESPSYSANSTYDGWESGSFGGNCYYWVSSCGATFMVMDPIGTEIGSCPHCSESHYAEWSYRD